LRNLAKALNSLIPMKDATATNQKAAHLLLQHASEWNRGMRPGEATRVSYGYAEGTVLFRRQQRKKNDLPYARAKVITHFPLANIPLKALTLKEASTSKPSKARGSSSSSSSSSVVVIIAANLSASGTSTAQQTSSTPTTTGTALRTGGYAFPSAYSGLKIDTEVALYRNNSFHHAKIVRIDHQTHSNTMLLLCQIVEL
jgi:hypothetical protein